MLRYQSLRHARSRFIELMGAMGGFAKQHEAGVADTVREGVEIGRRLP
jgi:hypothetical protein